MSVGSVHTNVGAATALQSLDVAGTELAAAQKQVSTGYRVADATDDGAAYAIAQGVRSDVGALTAANTQLANAQGLLGVTITALTGVVDELNALSALTIDIGSTGASGDQKAEYQTQYAAHVERLQSDFADATYNGQNLFKPFAPSASVIRDASGDAIAIGSFDPQIFELALSNPGNRNPAFVSVWQNQFGSLLNTYGDASAAVGGQIGFNSAKIDALDGGLGALVDADLGQQAAALQAAQTRQHLATQALSLANAAPGFLLALFAGATARRVE